ncbi:hypothetical protein CFP56_032138, partial [Quercus suber]
MAQNPTIHTKSLQYRSRSLFLFIFMGARVMIYTKSIRGVTTRSLGQNSVKRKRPSWSVGKKRVVQYVSVNLSPAMYLYSCSLTLSCPSPPPLSPQGTHTPYVTTADAKCGVFGYPVLDCIPTW